MSCELIDDFCDFYGFYDFYDFYDFNGLNDLNAFPVSCELSAVNRFDDFDEQVRNATWEMSNE